jgi:hypothetical protein
VLWFYEPVRGIIVESLCSIRSSEQYENTDGGHTGPVNVLFDFVVQVPTRLGSTAVCATTSDALAISAARMEDNMRGGVTLRLRRICGGAQ